MSAFLRKYGTGTGADIIIPMIKRGVVDYAVTADWTPATGDVKYSIDGGSATNIGTLPVINGTYGWKFVFADAELQGKSIRVTIVDSATKAVEDQMFIIETYGHASAMYKPDFSDSVRLGLTALPNAAADAAGGIPISDAGGLDLDAQLTTKINQIAADLPQRVTKNTALAKFPFKMVDSTDHITAETGLTVTATRSLDGAAFGACANSAAEIGSGWYYIDLDAADLNGNTVVLKFTATGADTREITIITQPT